MKRWIAGLLAVLLLPACGDGSKSPVATDATSAGLGAGQVPGIRIVSPDSGASSPEGSTVTVHAVVTDPDAVIARVDFYDDNRLIGSKSSPPYTISARRLKAGAHLLCAVAVDIHGVTTASSPVTLFVVQGNDDDKEDDDRDERDRKR